MTEIKIGDRPATVTKEGDHIKIVFHPMVKGAKHPKANMFTMKLSKSNLEMLKKAF